VNDNFSNLSLDAARDRIVEMMREDKRLYDRLLAEALHLTGQALGGDGPYDPDLRIESTSEMLGLPEFADVERMREVYRAIDQKSRLLQILNSCLAEDT